MKPKVVVSHEEEDKQVLKLTKSREKIAARRGTMMPLKAQMEKYKKEKQKPRSTYKNVYRWWEKDSVKYA